MTITVKHVADLVGGTVIGNLEDEIHGVSKIQESSPGDLTFLYLPSYSKYLSETKASAILVTPEENKVRNDITYIEVEKPDVALQLIVRKFFKPSLNITGIDKSADVSEDAVIGNDVALGKNVVVSPGSEIGDDTIIFHNVVLMDNVKIGTGTLIYPNTTVREDCVIGNNVIIHSGTVIGSDGFGYSPRKEGGYDKVPQIGNVVIEDDVEIGSNVSIDRAAMGSTIIRKGCKIDNLVQIAHNVEVGDDTAISSQVGIAGSTKIGKNCILAGQVGIVGHIEISDGVMLGAQSGVSKALPKPGKYFGSPAKELGQSLRLEGHMRNLPKYAERIKQLESELKLLKSKIIELTGDE